MGEYDADLRIFPDEFVPNVQSSKVYQRWAKSSPGDRGRWESFRDALLAGQEPSVPSMSTSFGRALVAAGKEHMSISQLVGTVKNPYPPTPPPPSGDYFVSLSGSDTTGDGSQNNPWRTLYKACSTVPAGLDKVISVAPGTYDETATCNLGNRTSIAGAGVSLTVIRPATAAVTPLLQVAGTTGPQTISGIKLDGRGKAYGDRGLNVSNASNLTVEAVEMIDFKGTASGGGCANLKNVSNCVVRNSTFRNGTRVWVDYYTGTLGVGDATNCTFHDLVVSDTYGMGVKGDGGSITNCEFYNVSSYADNNINYLVSWPLICFELWNMTAVNVTIRNCYFNRTVSLTAPGSAGPLGSDRYIVRNNYWNIPLASEASDGEVNYALECLSHNMHVHNNYIYGGAAPFVNSGTIVRSGMLYHHNVFDNQDDGGYALMRMDPGFGDLRFYENTYYRRQPDGNTGVMFHANAAGTPYIYDNIFSFSASEGDNRWGANALGTNWTNNVFYNIPTRGSGAITAGSQPLAVSGGFPAAYVPDPAYAGYGALADGSFTVGIQ